MWRWKALLTTMGWRLVNLGRWLVERGQRDSATGQPKVTPSCGCIMCDLRLPRQENNDGPGMKIYFHITQHGAVLCPRNF